MCLASASGPLARTRRGVVCSKVAEAQGPVVRARRRQQVRRLDDPVNDLDEWPPYVLARLGAELAETGSLGIGKCLALLERNCTTPCGRFIKLASDLVL